MSCVNVMNANVSRFGYFTLSFTNEENVATYCVRFVSYLPSVSPDKNINFSPKVLIITSVL